MNGHSRIYIHIYIHIDLGVPRAVHVCFKENLFHVFRRLPLSFSIFSFFISDFSSFSHAETHFLFIRVHFLCNVRWWYSPFVVFFMVATSLLCEVLLCRRNERSIMTILMLKHISPLLSLYTYLFWCVCVCMGVCMWSHPYKMITIMSSMMIHK